MIELANKAIQFCRDLALCSEDPDRTTRTFLSPPMHDVHRRLGGWMREVGMEVSVDAAGNLRGVHLGNSAKRLVIASHLDTVPNAGAFDGILGVVLGVALVEAVGQVSDLPSSQAGGLPTVEVIGFSEEEGVRFGIPFIGSRAVAGTLDENLLTPPVLDAIRAFGLDPSRLPAARLSPETTACIEFHIEQGPVLESLGLPLGIVDAVVGQSRLNLTFRGHSNHAGTTPMSLRHDALAAAAEWIGHVERVALAVPGLVATVGSIAVEPNATNVIPALTRVSLDVRHSCDTTRHSTVEEMLAAARQICGRRGISLDCEPKLDQSAVALDAHLREVLSHSVQGSGYPVHRMTSGAGHDAMILAPHVPTAMLFLRSPGGISHHPDEAVIAEDVKAAIEVGLRFIRRV
jgi:allantoate deiminase